MKKRINDLLLKMQTGENCIGETANKLLDLYSVSNSTPKKGTGFYMIVFILLSSLIAYITYAKIGFEICVITLLIIIIIILAAIRYNQ